MTAAQKQLQGKTALVTAAGQGIGRASAELFAAEGARVVAVDINPQTLAELDAVENISARELNITDAAKTEAFFAALEPLDILFNCAGYVADGAILECGESDWDFSFDLNVKAMYRTIRLALPAMLERGGGSIINMSSVASSLQGVPRRVAECASHGGGVGVAASGPGGLCGAGPTRQSSLSRAAGHPHQPTTPASDRRPQHHHSQLVSRPPR
ncbi:MAG: SDR family NAD(P)-dependent oxidoreductase [Alphaproteobacteria bacterium]|nr:SDR family NAD(P)-dependent oxidoreductase [Alphaproteobacteria bacterium]